MIIWWTFDFQNSIENEFWIVITTFLSILIGENFRSKYFSFEGKSCWRISLFGRITPESKYFSKRAFLSPLLVCLPYTLVDLLSQNRNLVILSSIKWISFQHFTSISFSWKIIFEHNFLLRTILVEKLKFNCVINKRICHL